MKDLLGSKAAKIAVSLAVVAFSSFGVVKAGETVMSSTDPEVVKVRDVVTQVLEAKDQDVADRMAKQHEEDIKQRQLLETTPVGMSVSLKGEIDQTIGQFNSVKSDLSMVSGKADCENLIEQYNSYPNPTQPQLDWTKELLQRCKNTVNPSN